MLKSLIMRVPKRGGFIIPSLEDQIRIIGGLLKLKHFDGIWCNGGTLTVRRLRDHFEVPRYLSWERAQLMLEAAEALKPKPAESLKSGRKTGTSVA